MKRHVSLLVSTLFFVFLFFRTTDAHALGPINIEVGAKVGYATNPNGDIPYNPLGLGIGARGGVEFFHGIYAGLNAMYYFGGSTDVDGGSARTHATQLGVEAGYGFHLSILTVRPQLGIGNATFTRTVPEGLPFAAPGGCFGDVANSDSHIYLQPGVTAIVTFGLLYVGADARLSRSSPP